MKRVAGFTIGLLIASTLLAGPTRAGETRVGGMADGATSLLSDSFGGYAPVYRLGVGGEVRFARGTALKAVPAALAQPVLAAHTEWRT